MKLGEIYYKLLCDRVPMVESIASVLLSSSPDIPEDIEEQDAELGKLTGELLKKDDGFLLLEALRLGITED